MSILGLDAALYVEDGDPTPAYVLVPMIRDVTLNLDKATADTSTRANLGWRTQRGTLKNSVVDFNLVYDVSDSSFLILRDAFLANTVKKYLVLDGPVGTDGSQGLMAMMDLVNFSENQPLEDVITFDVSLAASDDIANPPQWVEMSGGNPVPVAASVKEMLAKGLLSPELKDQIEKGQLALKNKKQGLQGQSRG